MHSCSMPHVLSLKHTASVSEGRPLAPRCPRCGRVLGKLEQLHPSHDPATARDIVAENPELLFRMEYYMNVGGYTSVRR